MEVQTNGAAVSDYRQQLLREEINPFEVHEEKTVEVLFGHLVERRGAVDAGVVDEKVKTFSLPCRFQRLPDGAGESVELAEIRNIELEERGFASELPDLP